ncbi:MAG TPA: 23S rRNA (cytosine(2499)-C(5))-methyltransferase, partial [Verrucomicrobiae bacterium]|nr:23S rRNA (cytosine(2499)-C(5))-methyltransferase [Verrucomicrobiae bacterium]
MNPGHSPKPPRLRLRVSAAAESVLRSGHPWLFAESIKEQNRAGELGELAVIYDRKDRFLAAGLFDPHSPIRVRILHAGKPQAINREWWQAHLDQAVARRRGLFDSQTTGWRCINGESDGWPGLVLDRYDETLALKLYTAAWLPRLDEVIELLRSENLAGAELLPAEPRLVLRLSRNIQQPAETRFHKRDGQILHGAPLTAPVVF